MKLAEVKERIKGLNEDQAKAVVCALVGHSLIQTQCLGYFNCARCGEQVGDAIGGAYRAEGVVVVGHACDKCRENFAKLTWRDKFMAPKKPLEKES